LKNYLIIEAKFYKLNGDGVQEIARRYDIRSLPTLMFLGKEKHV